jgi:hypothetical protein
MDGMTLAQAHTELAAALEPLGIEIGPETLRLWEDRQAHGLDPLPLGALHRLATLADRLTRERP